MYILIPCKGLASGKTRLSSCLTPVARRDFCTRLLTHTLEAALGVVTAGQIRLVTSDRDAIAVAQAHSVASLPDTGAGLNVALEAARTKLRDAASIGGIVILPIDLPEVTASAIRKALLRKEEMAIAADRRGSGTNLLLLRGQGLMQLRFSYGSSSYAAHLTQARERNFTFAELHDERLAFDIDEPDDYAIWRRREALINQQMLT